MAIRTMTCLFAFAAACSSVEPKHERLEFIRDRVHGVSRRADGSMALLLGPHSRVFVIHPKHSPRASALETFAEGAQRSTQPVYATVWIRRKLEKKPENLREDGKGPAFVVVRLAATPDPREVNTPRS